MTDSFGYDVDEMRGILIRILLSQVHASHRARSEGLVEVRLLLLFRVGLSIQPAKCKVGSDTDASQSILSG